MLKLIFVTSSIAASVMVLCSLRLDWCNTTVCCLREGPSSSSRASDRSEGRRQHSNGGWLFTRCSLLSPSTCWTLGSKLIKGIAEGLVLPYKSTVLVVPPLFAPWLREI